jgi:subtilisin family serine protease
VSIRRGAWQVWLAVLTSATSALANPDARALGLAIREAPGASLPAPLLAPGSQTLPLLVELDPASDPRDSGLVPVVPGFAVGRASPGELSSFVVPPHTSYRWAPPRHLLLDQASLWTRATAFRQATGLGGAGVVIGIVDSGVEARHQDLRDANGHTRVAWLLDFSRPPAGLHPDLEANYGCTAPGASCAIFSAEDIDAAIAGDGGSDEPRDPLGHGTHVASLAAGNGRTDDPPRLVGMAPEATLIAVRATRQNGGGVLDADVLLGVRFVYERAADLGLPAVVNLSLGSDFGAHDGGSLLERALAEFVGSGRPGRGLVVSAGNSGVMHVGTGSGYPEPLGVHTEVHVPRGTSVRVPLLSPPIGTAETRATIFVWLATRAGDELAVGFERSGVSWLGPVGIGKGRARADGGLTVTVLNRAGEVPGTGEQGAVVIVDGAWATGSVFALRLEGHGTASLWAQSEGDLAPEVSRMGALFARASQQGTVTVPASHPSLVSVGATLDRVEWTDRAGEAIHVLRYGSLVDPPADSVAYFSSAGPTHTGNLKPDLVAPGAFVIGAMASQADPFKNGGWGVFAQSSVCELGSYCLVMDAHHAALEGTSVAAPLVSGAMALLLSQDPTLTQNELRNLLQAGARRPEGLVPVEQQTGPGALDLGGSLAVLERQRNRASETLPAAGTSWVTLADEYAHPDPTWPLLGSLSLRSESGEIADGFDPARLVVDSSVGMIDPPLTRDAPGFWRFGLTCPRHSGGQTLHLAVRFDGQPLSDRRVPIAVDRAVAAEGFATRGGCTVSAESPSAGRSVLIWLGICLGSLCRRAKRRRALPWILIPLGCSAVPPPNVATARAPEPRPPAQPAPTVAAPQPTSGSVTTRSLPAIPELRSTNSPPEQPAERRAPAEPPADGDDAVLLAAGRRVQECFERAFTGTSVPAGELRLTLVLDLAADGHVTSARVDEPRTSRGLLDGGFPRCALDAVRERRFAEQKSERTLELPFTLEPLGR